MVLLIDHPSDVVDAANDHRLRDATDQGGVPVAGETGARFLKATVMARPPKLTDDEILQRARAVFVERGYGARTPEIAAAVGLCWGALVFRFGGKAELFRRAMADSICGSGAVDWLHAVGGGLHRLLGQLSSHLWQQWPIYLQYRLASKSPTQNEEPDRGLDQLGEWLSFTLEALAARGAVRSDMPASTLAQIILSLLVGEVARRFLGGERTFAADAALLDGVMRLMTPRGAGSAGRKNGNPLSRWERGCGEGRTCRGIGNDR